MAKWQKNMLTVWIFERLKFEFLKTVESFKSKNEILSILNLKWNVIRNFLGWSSIDCWTSNLNSTNNTLRIFMFVISRLFPTNLKDTPRPIVDELTSTSLMTDDGEER